MAGETRRGAGRGLGGAALAAKAKKKASGLGWLWWERLLAALHLLKMDADRLAACLTAPAVKQESCVFLR